MMSTPLILDSFDVALLGSDTDFDGAVTSDGETAIDPMTGLGIKPPRPDDSSLGDDATDQDEPDTAAEIEALFADLAMITETVKGETAQAFRSHLQAVDSVIRDAVLQVLPHVADEGAVGEICGVIIDSATALGGMAIQVKLHPSAHDRVVNCLEDRDFPEPITVTSDDTVAHGVAQLTWTDGGCHIDVPAALDRAKLIIDARLDALGATTGPAPQSQGDNDE